MCAEEPSIEKSVQDQGDLCRRTTGLDRRSMGPWQTKWLPVRNTLMLTMQLSIGLVGIGHGQFQQHSDMVVLYIIDLNTRLTLIIHLVASLWIKVFLYHPDLRATGPLKSGTGVCVHKWWLQVET